MDYNNISDINMSDIEKSTDYDNLVFSIISDKFRVLLIENSISEFINYKKLIQNFDCYLEVAYSGREGVHKYKYSSECQSRGHESSASAGTGWRTSCFSYCGSYTRKTGSS